MYFTSLVTQLSRETKLYKVSFPGLCIGKGKENGLNVVFDFSQFSFMHKPGKLTVFTFKN